MLHPGAVAVSDAWVCGAAGRGALAGKQPPASCTCDLRPTSSSAARARRRSPQPRPQRHPTTHTPPPQITRNCGASRGFRSAQRALLSLRELEALRAHLDVKLGRPDCRKPWLQLVWQTAGDRVRVPPGWLHQVQNLKPNIKVAFDIYRQDDFSLYLKRCAGCRRLRRGPSGPRRGPCAAYSPSGR
jgi:hypothetical protein